MYKIYDNELSSLQHEDTDVRFIIIKDSVSAHCCFTCTVIDTKVGKNKSGGYWESSMCETFYESEAIKICTALNINSNN